MECKLKLSYPILGNVVFKHSVLVSAGIELNFFLVAGVVLCFGFGMKIMLTT